MDKDLKELMEKHNVPCKVVKAQKKTIDLNPQDRVIDCDYIDPAGFPYWDKDQFSTSKNFISFRQL